MRFTHLLTVEQDTPGSELNGESVENWREVRDVMGTVSPLTGREHQQAEQMQSNVTHRITTRYFTGADSRMRLRRGSRVFNVQSVVNVEERNRELEWMVTEVV